jgi:hypothetical protein
VALGRVDVDGHRWRPEVEAWGRGASKVRGGLELQGGRVLVMVISVAGIEAFLHAGTPPFR